MMPLYEKRVPQDRRARGLSEEARHTYHLVYLGTIEFGYYHCVKRGPEETWRWGTYFPLPTSADGFVNSEDEAIAMLAQACSALIEGCGLEPKEDRPASQPVLGEARP